MGKKIVVGIDGGGTTTVALAADTDGNILAQVSGNTINYNSVGMDKARSNMRSVFSELCEKCGTERFDAVFIGMSALYKEADEEEVYAFANGIIPADRVMMNSDLYVALQSSGVSAECVLVISGTGSMVISRDAGGVIHETGGWGYLLGDQGSAFSIAINAIKTAVTSADGVTSETSLLPAVMKFFNIDEPRLLIDRFYDPVISRDAVASFAPFVADCAENGDETALGIICSEAEFLAKVCCTAIGKLRTHSVPVLTYGGVFLHNEMFRDIFGRRVKEKYPECSVGMLSTPPQLGAVYSCIENCTAELRETLRNNYFKMINK